MIKQIAPNIDDLLTRYSRQDTVSSLNAIQDTSATLLTNKTPEDEDNPIDMIINRIERLERNQPSQRPQAQRFRMKNKFSNSCVHCSFLNKQLDTSFNIKHATANCPRKQVSISVINSMEMAAADPIVQDSDSSQGEVRTALNNHSPIVTL